MSELRTYTYGTSGPAVIVLHGGPGAVGSAAPVARGLAEWFRVLEPWQRGSGDEPLTVARHVEDLHELLESRGDRPQPALVGLSWGAMLALAYAAAHPESAGPIVLVGCGTFDLVARACLRETLEERTDDALRRRLEGLSREFRDPGEQMRRMHELSERLYSYQPIVSDPEEPHAAFDFRAHTETWNDMVRLQREGVYPAAFSAVTSPVIMLHGAYDPHPGQLIRASLEPHIAQLEYREWECCGHSPWAEKLVRDEFFTVLREWLLTRLADDAIEK